MAFYYNPRGTVNGTPDADTFLFDTYLGSNTIVDGLGGVDTLIVDRSADGLTTFVAEDTNGALSGYVHYNYMLYQDRSGILSYTNIENVNFIGGVYNDSFSVLTHNPSSGLQLDYDGGDGVDSLSFSADYWTTPLIFTVDDETVTSSFGHFTNIENFHIRGGSGNDVIHTGAGNDTLTGGSGTNDLSGGSGNDSFSSTMGVDTIDGGVGYDFWSVEYSAGTAALVADIGSTVTLSNGSSATNIEGMNITTGSGNDQFNVTRAIGHIEAGSGYDILNYAIAADAIHRDYIVTGYGTYLGGSVGTYVVDGGHTAFSGIEKVVLKGGASGDTFQLSGNFAASAIDFDGGGQLPNFINELWADFSALTGNSTFVLNPDGTIVSNRGTFANFYQVSLTGAGGNDVFTTQDGSDRLTGAGGDDVLSSGAGADLLNGGSGADQLYGGAGNDELIGGTNNDLLDGGSGDDKMTGGTGSDVYVVDSAGDTIEENPGEGTDEVRTGLASYSLAGLGIIENLTAASDSPHDFRGNSGNNVVTGGGGNDVLRLYDGGNDSVFGGGGDDNIFFIAALTAADVINGGSGTDTLVLQGPYGSLTLTASITQIENISILAGSNTNFGDPGTNLYDYVLTTNDANFAAGVQARINGAALLAGEDLTFDGSAETDAKFVVYGGKGKDTLTGGLGNDIFFYAEERFATGDTVNGGAGYDGMFLRGNYTIDFNAPGYTGLFTNIENLTLTSATDERYARGGGTEFDYNLVLSDAIVKPGETLTVSGALLMTTETMILDASQEADGFLRLFGGRADDTLKGGANADLIHGNLGADQLTGNGGADVFRIDSTAESNAGAMDHILDFAAGTDKIDISRVDADSVAAGDQAFAWIGSNAFSGTAGELRAYEQSGTWFVEGDTNGDSVADLVIALTLQGPTPLSAADFLL